MAEGRAGRPKPWWRRWYGLPGEIPPDQFITPTVADQRRAAVVQIARDHRYADSRRAYNVWVDDEIVGTVVDGGAFQIMLDPGSHRIRLTLSSSWSSPELVLNLDASAVSHFRCCNNFGWAPVVSLVLGLFLPFRWIRLWADDADNG